MAYNQQGVSQAGAIYTHVERCPTFVNRQSCLRACYHNYSFWPALCSNVLSVTSFNFFALSSDIRVYEKAVMQELPGKFGGVMVAPVHAGGWRLVVIFAEKPARDLKEETRQAIRQMGQELSDILTH